MILKNHSEIKAIGIMLIILAFSYYFKPMREYTTNKAQVCKSSFVESITFYNAIKGCFIGE